MLQFLLSKLFPPKISHLAPEDWRKSAGYLERMARLNLPRHQAGQAWGRVTLPAREKSVIYLPGRVV